MDPDTSDKHISSEATVSSEHGMEALLAAIVRKWCDMALSSSSFFFAKSKFFEPLLVRTVMIEICIDDL